VGSAKAYRHFGGQIAVRAQAPMFIADYALAPERPFPAAVEDAEAAYRALAATGASRLAIVGDSAGGGLALVVAKEMSRTARGAVPTPAATVALSPWTDLALTGESITTRAGHDPLLTATALQAARQRYLGGHDPTDPRASALYGDLSDLPPTMLHVGEDEILLDDARRYLERLNAAGSTGELHVWKGMVHVFPANLALLGAAREATDTVGTFLRRRLANTPPSTAVV
jgi:acetyl esterase/lipase